MRAWAEAMCADEVDESSGTVGGAHALRDVVFVFG
jgi:hypothetical protein